MAKVTITLTDEADGGVDFELESDEAIDTENLTRAQRLALQLTQYFVRKFGVDDSDITLG